MMNYILYAGIVVAVFGVILGFLSFRAAKALKKTEPKVGFKPDLHRIVRYNRFRSMSYIGLTVAVIGVIMLLVGLVR